MTTPHAKGYYAYRQFGMTARNPYDIRTHTEQNYQWARGFDKARREAASHS